MKTRYILVLVLFALMAQFAKAQVSKNFSQAYLQEGTLYLAATEQYNASSSSEKASLINANFTKYNVDKIHIVTAKNSGELWMVKDGKFVFVDDWFDYDLKLDQYKPLEIDRQGRSRWYYYIGGSFSGQKGQTTLVGNLRAGTFLYKDFLDVSAAVSGGFNSSSGKSDGVLSFSVSSKAYLPFRLKDFNIAPYAGVGVSAAILPSSSIEPIFLAGACWFVGPGGLDVGLQFGTKSKFAFTVGYTFRPSF